MWPAGALIALPAVFYNSSNSICNIGGAGIFGDHPVNGNVITWDFRNIKLPGAGTNYSGSRGYVIFRIKANTNLAVPDSFFNKAAIYFDYNLPTLTGTVKTTLGSSRAVCPNTSVSFSAGLTGATYQWQVDIGSGYSNLSNGGIYSGVNTPTLTLSTVSTSFAGFRYRCLVNGNIYSPENILRFSSEWTGALNNVWTNPGNWTCNVVPDANTAVYIPSGTTAPFISSNVACYSLTMAPNTTVLVISGFGLSITGKNN
ncbi:MAG: hypothetical protein EOP51_34635 [Sphingobacteriales bacterium]|nr:MAG: hypothetical protein EOP51_34635 [Sphingobacteriales bacterium]